MYNVTLKRHSPISDQGREPPSQVYMKGTVVKLTCTKFYHPAKCRNGSILPTKPVFADVLYTNFKLFRNSFVRISRFLSISSCCHYRDQKYLMMLCSQSRLVSVAKSISVENISEYRFKPNCSNSTENLRILITRTRVRHLERRR